jgi:hypothetical protein
MILCAATNENAGTDNINAPSGGGWTLLHTARQGTIDVNQAIYGKISAGGETSVTITSSVSQRFQTWFGEFSGYMLAPESSTGTGSTPAVTTITTTAINGATDSLFIGLVTCKNSVTSLSYGSGYTQATVTNEGGATSTQKLTMGVWYRLLAPATNAQVIPTWTTAAAVAAIGQVCKFSSKTTDPLVQVRRTWAGR